MRLHGGAPYLRATLGACEAALRAPGYAPFPLAEPQPFPYPPATILALFPLALRPFPIALIVWLGGLTLATFLAVEWTARSRGVPVSTAFALIGLPLMVILPELGEPTAAVACGLAAAWRADAVGRGRLAALALIPTLIDPRFAACAYLGVATVYRRAVLLPLMAIGAGVGALSILGGLAANARYIHDILPLHALLHLWDYRQVALAGVLYAMGIPAALALRLGNLALAAGVTLGVAAIIVAARRGMARAGLFALPLCALLIGGPYFHPQQLVALIPVVWGLCDRVGTDRRVLYALLALLPATALAPRFMSEPALALLALAALCFGARGMGFSPRGALVIGALVVALPLACELGGALLPGPAPGLAAVTIPSTIAQAGEQAGMVRAFAAFGEVGRRVIFAIHLPTWAAIHALVALLARGVWRGTRPGLATR